MQRSGGPRATALLLALGGKHVQGVRIRQIDCWYGKYHHSELALKAVHAAEKPTSQRGKPFAGDPARPVQGAHRREASLSLGGPRRREEAISSARRVFADAMPQMRIVREEIFDPRARVLRPDRQPGTGGSSRQLDPGVYGADTPFGGLQTRRRLPGGPGTTARPRPSVRRPAPERRTRNPHRAPS